jgi:hypothetical protein
MNERIKELAEQAGLKINTGQEIHLWWLERFADLVRQDLYQLIGKGVIEQINSAVQMEREANAKLADDFERLEYEAVGDPRIPAFKSLIGEAIRARGNRTKTSKDICDND